MPTTVDAAVGVDALGFVGQELGEGREGRLRLTERLHLEPVAEQHDRDEGGQLPPELEVEPSDAWWRAMLRTRR